MAELLRAFVPVADEVGRLQRGEDRECAFFQSFAELGHYGGRTDPSNTRQGIYAVAPSGAFLASVNTRSARQVATMLERALAAWDELAPGERFLDGDPAAERGASRRREARFPAGGVALRVTARDLPREGAAADWRALAWNEDWAWLRPEELRALFAAAAEAEIGASWPAPEGLARRIARAQLLDFVRGQTSAFRDAEVERADLRVVLEDRRDGQARLRLEGSSRAAASGRWRVAGFDPEAGAQTRGFEAEWLGFARWSLAEERLAELELIAFGTRWGGTQFNGRADDLDPAPMALVLQLEPDYELEPRGRVAPAQLGAYGW